MKTRDELADERLASEVRYRAKADDATLLRQLAESTVALVELDISEKRTNDAIVACNELSQILIDAARKGNQSICISASVWLLEIASAVASESEFETAINCCKAAVAILENQKANQGGDEAGSQLCISLVRLSELLDKAGSRPAATEAAIYAVETAQSLFPDLGTKQSVGAARALLAQTMIQCDHGFNEARTLFDREAQRLISKPEENGTTDLGHKEESLRGAGQPVPNEGDGFVAVMGEEPSDFLDRVPLTEETGSYLTVGTQTAQNLVSGEEDELEALKRIVGRFELLEQVAAGGMGVIYKARDKTLDRIVALKIPRVRGLDTKSRDHLLQEAKAHARCSHVNIVPVYDLGSDDGVVYIVMKFISGGSLKWQFSRENRLVTECDYRHQARIFEQISLALNHAHEQDIIHRDVKGSNILLDETGVPYLADFGLAVEGGENQEGTIAGTPLYMSPEQTQGKAIDPRTDIYSLGVTIFETMTGEMPLRNMSRKEIRHAKLHDSFPRPSEVSSSIPKDLEAIILKCTQRNPDDRYQSAMELALDLRRFLDGQVVAGRYYSSWELLARHVESNLVKAISGFSLLVALFIASWVQWIFIIPFTMVLLVSLTLIALPLINAAKQPSTGVSVAKHDRRWSVVKQSPQEIVFSSQVVVTHYPLPIALPYRRFCTKTTHRDRLDAMYFAFEAMLRYLVYLGLADLSSRFIRLAPRDRVFPDHKHFDFLRRSNEMTMGVWVGTLREIVRALGKQKSNFIPELIDVCTPGGHFDQHVLESLVNKRNKKLIHREGFASLSEPEAKDLLVESRALFEEALKQIEFIRHYPLGFATPAAGASSKSGELRFRVHSCMGAGIRDAYVEEFRTSLRTRVPFVVSPNQEKLLYLWPWILEQDSEKTGRESLYAFEKISGYAHQYLTRVRLASFEIGEPWEIQLRDEPSDNHNWYFRQLKELPVELVLDRGSQLRKMLVPTKASNLVGKRLATYEIDQAISEGNFATIYLAKSRSGRALAIKVIEARDGIRQLERFTAEFEKLKSAGSHDAVLTCYETGVEVINGREYPWYSMEFAVGGDLFSKMLERRANNDFPWSDAETRSKIIEEFSTICSAVAHLHKLEIVHRDIKPSNVLIMEDGSLRLSDFGLVKNLRPSEQSLMQRHATSTGAVLGTPFYMSPEQEQGSNIGKQADVYSLGVLLLEMITGDLPKPVPKVSSGSRLINAVRMKDLPKSMAKLILRMTDVDPSRRPKDALEVHDRFQHAVAPG